MIRLHTIVTLFCLAFGSCDKDPQLAPIDTSEISKTELYQGLQEFQWQVFQQTVSEEANEENISLSPLSIATALYLALEGSSGSTKREMMDALSLHYEESATLGSAYNLLREELFQVVGAVDLTLVNSVFWDQNRLLPHDDFMDKMTKSFTAEEFPMDFSSANALPTINDWVKTKTQNRIEKILDDIRDEEVMFLLNAIYFKADWSNPFPLESTRKGEFIRGDGSTVEVPFMFKDVFEFKSHTDSDLQAVEIPFADTNYVMNLIQPAQTQSIDQLIRTMSANRLNALFEEDLKAGRIFLHMPKFEVTYETEMSSVLKAMGMIDAFSSAADFSKLGTTTGGKLFLSRVNHKTFLSIDEKGAEGAAVTSVGVGVTSLPPTFKFDRPFVYLIRNRVTGAFLFVGKLENP